MRQQQVSANYQKSETGSMRSKAEQYAKPQLEESKPRSIGYRANLGGEDPNESEGVIANLLEACHRAWNLQLAISQLQVAEGWRLKMFHATNL